MKVFLGLLLLGLALAEKVRFDNYRVYKLTPNDEESLDILRAMQENDELTDYNFWGSPVAVGVPVEIMVSPSMVTVIEDLAESRGMNYSIMMDNVQHYIDNEGLRPESRAGSFDWTSYHTFDEVSGWLAVWSLVTVFVFSTTTSW